MQKIARKLPPLAGNQGNGVERPHGDLASPRWPSVRGGSVRRGGSPRVGVRSVRLVVALAGTFAVVPAATAVAQLPPPQSPLPIDAHEADGTVQDTSEAAGKAVEDAVEVVKGIAGVKPDGDPGRVAGSDPGQASSSAQKPKISVRKTNDADQDGKYSDDEVAPEPEADVRFRVRIKNKGTGAVEIASVTDSYGATTEEVCEQLVGELVDPGKSASCTFELEDYAPPQYDSLANTVEVVAAAAGDSTKRTTKSDVSTVTTLDGGSEAVVLGETAASEEGSADGGDVAGTTTEEEAAPAEPAPNPNADSLPTTGFAVARLALLAATLGLTGGTLLYAGRRRARRVRVHSWAKA
jgi:hypothetical protein